MKTMLFGGIGRNDVDEGAFEKNEGLILETVRDMRMWCETKKMEKIWGRIQRVVSWSILERILSRDIWELDGIGIDEVHFVERWNWETWWLENGLLYLDWNHLIKTIQEDLMRRFKLLWYHGHHVCSWRHSRKSFFFF